MYLSESMNSRCRIFWLDAEKFKTNLYVLFFEFPLKKETATKNALLAEVLKQGCKAHPTMKALAEAAEDMYGALWDISIVKKGDKQLLMVSMEVLKCVESGEVLSFFHGLLFEPLTADGGFVQEIVERQKEVLRRQILAQQDDKKSYAERRCLEISARGSALAINASGYAADLDEIDAQGLFRYYQMVLRSARVKVFFCGERNERKKLHIFRRWFPGENEMTPWAEKFEGKATKAVFACEHKNLEQARLMMCFRIPSLGRGRRRAAGMILSYLLGGAPDSMLFSRVREEEGLCYDIKSYLYPHAPFLFVRAGIDTKDAKKASRAVIVALDEIAKKGIMPEQLAYAKKAIIGHFRILPDLPWEMVDFSVNRIFEDAEADLDIYLRHIARVCASDVQLLANQAELSTIYMLSGKEDV